MTFCFSSKPAVRTTQVFESEQDRVHNVEPASPPQELHGVGVGGFFRQSPSEALRARQGHPSGPDSPHSPLLHGGSSGEDRAEEVPEDAPAGRHDAAAPSHAPRTAHDGTPRPPADGPARRPDGTTPRPRPHDAPPRPHGHGAPRAWTHGPRAARTPPHGHGASRAGGRPSRPPRTGPPGPRPATAHALGRRPSGPARPDRAAPHDSDGRATWRPPRHSATPRPGDGPRPRKGHGTPAQAEQRRHILPGRPFGRAVFFRAPL